MSVLRISTDKYNLEPSEELSASYVPMNLDGAEVSPSISENSAVMDLDLKSNVNIFADETDPETRDDQDAHRKSTVFNFIQQLKGCSNDPISAMDDIQEVKSPHSIDSPIVPNVTDEPRNDTMAEINSAASCTSRHLCEELHDLMMNQSSDDQRRILRYSHERYYEDLKIKYSQFNKRRISERKSISNSGSLRNLFQRTNSTGLIVTTPVRKISEPSSIEEDLVSENASGYATPDRITSPVKETHYMKREKDAKTGQKMINQYLILQELGRGVHGKVKLAFDTELNDFVAIKVVRKKKAKVRLGMTSMADGTMDKIRKEVAIMKKCINPHVTRLFEVIDDPKAEKIYMVLEYLDGGDLPWQNRFCTTYSIPIDITRSIFRDLILGVEYLHYQGIIHRDIKPANILLTKAGIAKLSDFGVSYTMQSDISGKKEMTEFNINQTAGSPAFFAPELCLGVDELKDMYGEDILTRKTASLHGQAVNNLPDIGKAVDVWAMGITLYCFVFGRIPFEAESEFDLLNKIPYMEVSFPFQVDPLLQDLMEKLLQKNPLKRITLEDLKVHPWVLGGTDQDRWIEPQVELELVQISDQDVASAYTSVMERIRRQMRKLSASISSFRKKSGSYSIFPTQSVFNRDRVALSSHGGTVIFDGGFSRDDTNAEEFNNLSDNESHDEDCRNGDVNSCSKFDPARNQGSIGSLNTLVKLRSKLATGFGSTGNNSIIGTSKRSSISSMSSEDHVDRGLTAGSGERATGQTSKSAVSFFRRISRNIQKTSSGPNMMMIGVSSSTATASLSSASSSKPSSPFYGNQPQTQPLEAPQNYHLISTVKKDDRSNSDPNLGVIIKHEVINDISRQPRSSGLRKSINMYGSGSMSKSFSESQLSQSQSQIEEEPTV